MARRGRYFAAFGLGALLLICATVLMLTATGPGQRALLRVAEWAASSTDSAVRIGRLEGSLFSQGRIALVALADAEGIWAEVEDIRFDWNPWALLGGTVDVESIGIGKLFVRRKPGETAGSQTAENGGSVPIPPLRLGKLTIDEAVLGEAVLGAAARLSVSAQVLAADPANAITGAVLISDLDRPSLLMADLQYRAQTGALQIAAKAEDQAGGVLSRLLEMGESRDIRLAMDGGGPIDDWRGEWSFAADGERLAGGSLTARRGADGLRVAAGANGEIARLLPNPFAQLLAGTATLSAEGRFRKGDSYRLDRLQLEAPRIRAQASGALDLAGGGIQGDARIEIRDTGLDRPIALQFGGGAVLALRQANLALSAKPGPDGTAVSAVLDAANIDWRDNRADRIFVSLSARQPKGAAHPLGTLDAISLAGELQNPLIAEAALQPIAGERVRLEASGGMAGERLTIERATLSAGAGSAEATGTLDAAGFDGKVTVSMPDAKAISQLAGRELSGAVDVTATGQAGLDGVLDLSLEGQGERIAAGDDLIGKLLAGTAKLSGSVGRDSSGAIRFDGLALSTDSFNLTLAGSLGADAASANLQGEVADLSRLLPGSSGAIQVEAAIEGVGDARQITAKLAADDAKIRGKRLRGVTLSYAGRGGFDAQTGDFSASGRIGEAPLTGAGQLAYSAADGARLSAFTLALGNNRIEADGALPASGDAHGEARLHLADAAELAPILGVLLSGSATAAARLSGSAQAPSLAITASSEQFSYNAVEMKALSADIAITDAVRRPAFSGTASIQALKAGGTRIAALKLTAEPSAERSTLALSARIDGKWQVAGKASLALADWQPEAALHGLSIRSGGTTLTQQGTAQISTGDGLRLSGLVMAAGKGRISADAVASETLAGKVEIEQFPASIGALFAPDMQPRGTLAGSLTLAGSTAAPEIAYKLSWAGAGIAGTLPPAFPPLDLSASGVFRGDALSLDAAATGPGGLKLKMDGNIASLSTDARLALKAGGPVPLALASAFLAARGTALGGSANVDLTIGGTVSRPAIAGRIAASGASIKDPPTGIALKDASLAARLSNGTLRIETLKARSEGGAEVTATGTLGILASPKLPVDLQIKTGALRFDDQRTAKGDVAADLTLKGNLNGASALSGTVDISRLDIQIPQSLPASVEALELKHENAPSHIAAAQPGADEGEKARLPSSIALSLTIRAASRIFVKGRGLDAQLGGELQLLGSAETPRALGEFRLERGRLALLGRTLDFTSGSVNFNGDLDPLLNFVATTDASGAQINVTVSGQASAPKFSFSSNPELPEDEVLALLLFNKSLGELSPFQVAQLASEVGELSGISGGPGILSGIRSGMGIDTLNITTDKDGESAISAGSYINEKVFVGVEQGLGGDSSRVKVDLDITKNLKLRGETDADGQSKLGIGVEWDY